MTTDRFIDLDRRFRDVTDSENPEEIAVRSYATLWGIEPGIPWSAVLASRIVIILGEPGSGKTWEMRNQAAHLRTQVTSAFFIPLERLVDGSLMEAIAPEDWPVLEEWKKSGESATFFLDSVDEAKVRKVKDFPLALDNFVRGIGLPRTHQIHLVISARISEWERYADFSDLFQRFGVKREGKEPKDKPPDLRIVQIEPLDKQRIRKFAEGIGLQDIDGFIEALDFHHAWEFARRPIDVVSLIVYWQENNRLGSLTELIEFDLRNKLRESQERSQNDPLSQEEARKGAECLAAGVIFCRRFSFPVPDSIVSESTSRGIDAIECLPPDWTPLKCKALLSRAVFDVANYGYIRFHHRRISEYLAARWLDGRMTEGCPYPILEDLLFAQQNGKWIIRPSLRPVTAWLASANEPWHLRIRQNILSSAPGLFLELGDPESLPVDYKQELLERLIAHYAGWKRIFIDAEAETLRRLADPRLGAYIKRKVLDRTIATDLRLLLLRIIQHGRLSDCLDAALDIVASPQEAEEIKSYAVAAIRDVGDNLVRQRLAQTALDFDVIGVNLFARLFEALYPWAIRPVNLTNLFRKLREIPLQYSIDLPWNLKRHLEANLPDNQAAELLHELVNLFQEVPHLHREDEETPISARFSWLGKVIPTVLICLLKRPQLVEEEVSLIGRTLWLLGKLQYEERPDEKVEKSVNTLLDRHPMARRSFVCLKIAEERKKEEGNGIHFLAVYGLFDLVKAREADIDWLIRDIDEGSSRTIRTDALRLAVDLWRSFDQKRSIRTQIKRVLKNDLELHQLFKAEIKESRYLWFRRFSYRHGLYSRELVFLRIRHKLRQLYSKLKTTYCLYRDLRKIRNGTAIIALYNLACEASEDQQHWGAHSWRPLIKKRGGWIAQAAGNGWKMVWRRFEPPLPNEKPEPNKTDYRVIVGLSGINVARDDGTLNFETMTPKEARIACRYAVNELNGFPYWLTELARHHGDAVRDVLAECIRAEWRIPVGPEYVNGVIEKLRYHGKGLAHLVGGLIVEELQTCDPPHHEVLEAALSILLNLPEPPNPLLANLAARRISLLPVDDPRFALWMVILLQIDAGPAIKKIKELVSQISDPDNLVTRICANLSDRHSRGSPLIRNPDYMKPEYLFDLIPLVYNHVRIKDDINRIGGGAYSPTLRDEAQDFRNGLIERLAQLPGHDADNVLKTFMEHPLLCRYRDRILYHLERRAEMAADGSPWQPADIPSFMREYEINPRSDHDLFKIACRRLSSIKDEVERGEISSRSDLHPDDHEGRLRSWLARQLRDRSRGRYTVPQEEEIDLGQKPDLRVEAPGMGPISIEIKWADNWTLQELEKGLTDQLVGQYLRAPDSNYGIYVLGYKGRGKKFWIQPQTGEHLTFPKLISLFQDIAEVLVKEQKNINGLKVFGVDFSQPSFPRK